MHVLGSVRSEIHRIMSKNIFKLQNIMFGCKQFLQLPYQPACGKEEVYSEVGSKVINPGD